MAERPFDLCGACRARLDAWLESKPTEYKAPLTREKIVEAMKTLGVYFKIVPVANGNRDRRFHECFGPRVEAAILDEWTSFYFEYAPELLAFALAHLSHEPCRAGTRGPYQKRGRGEAQRKILAALESGPKSARELIRATGSAERNLRHSLDVLVAIGLAFEGFDPIADAKCWALSPDCLPEGARPVVVTDAERAAAEALLESVTAPAAPPVELTKPAEMGSASPDWDPDWLFEHARSAPAAPALPEADPEASNEDEKEEPARGPQPLQRPPRQRVRRKVTEQASEVGPVRTPPPAWMQKPLKPPGR